MLGTHIVAPNNDFNDYVSLNVTAPASFDARTQWPSCVHAIRDQSQCGSCWAFGSTEALSDRFCIASSGKVNVVLSPQDLVACDKSNYGCNGGYLNLAWAYLKSTGVVTDACQSYQSASGKSPACKTTCDNASTPYKKYKVSSVVHPTSVEDIKKELSTNGPLETGFTVYEDFYNYKSGVYHHTTGSQLGGHAIKVLGYGTEGGVNYWLCANSWGTSFGE